MADEPMSDERLAEIRRRMHEIDTYLRQSLIQPRMPGVPVDGVLYNGASDAVDAATVLLAEVDRLRAREVAAMAIVEKLVSLWLVTDDSHAPRRLTYLYPRDGAVDVEALREEARALLTQE